MSQTNRREKERDVGLVQNGSFVAKRDRQAHLYPKMREQRTSWGYMHFLLILLSFFLLVLKPFSFSWMLMRDMVSSIW